MARHDDFARRFYVDAYGRFSVETEERVDARKGLRERVNADIAAIHKTLPRGWKGHEECPPPPPELTDTYAVAFASAARKCEHRNSHSTTYARRERQCDDCGRYFTRKEWYE